MTPADPRRDPNDPRSSEWPSMTPASGYPVAGGAEANGMATAQVPLAGAYTPGAISNGSSGWPDAEASWPPAGGTDPFDPSDPEYHEAMAAAEAVSVGRGGPTYLAGLPSGRVKVVERFKGPRLKHRTGLWRRLRSAILLILIGLILAAALAAILSMAVWGISIGIHHLTNSTTS
jgi:hypothetical protein